MAEGHLGVACMVSVCAAESVCVWGGGEIVYSGPFPNSMVGKVGRPNRLREKGFQWHLEQKNA